MKKLLVAAVAVLSISIIAPGVVGRAFCQESASAEAGAQGGLFEAARLVVGTGIENREPVGVAETFPASTEKVYCFLEAKNIAEDTQAVFVWYFGGAETDKISINMKKGSKWRTYSNKTIAGRTGEWKVDIQDSAGNVLKTVNFKIE